MDTAIFEALIVYAISEGGAIAFGYWVMELVPCLRNMANGELKRILAYLFAGLAADVLYALAVFVEARPLPETPKAWAQTMVTIALVAIIGNQLLHGRLDLSPTGRATKAKARE